MIVHPSLLEQFKSFFGLNSQLVFHNCDGVADCGSGQLVSNFDKWHKFDFKQKQTNNYPLKESSWEVIERIKMLLNQDQQKPGHWKSLLIFYSNLTSSPFYQHQPSPRPMQSKAPAASTSPSPWTPSSPWSPTAPGSKPGGISATTSPRKSGWSLTALLPRSTAGDFWKSFFFVGILQALKHVQCLTMAWLSQQTPSFQKI